MNRGWLRLEPDLLLERWNEVRAAGPGRNVHIPVVALLTTVLPLAVGIWSRSVFGSIPATVGRSFGWSVELFAAGEIWRVFTAIPITRDPFMLGGMVLSLLLAVGGLEYLAGRWRAALMFVYGAVGGYVGVTLGVLLLRGLGLPAAQQWARTLDYGASAGVAACSAAMVVLIGRRSVVLLGVAVIIGGLVLHHQVADWEHAFSFASAAMITYATTRRSASTTSTAPG